MSKIRVVVADDHIYAAEGLQKIVSDADDLECVGSTTVLLDLPGLIKKNRPDVLVLDIAWLGDKRAGLEILPDLRAIHPTIKVVTITVYPEMLEPARQAGTYPLSKGFSRHELWNAIRWAARKSANENETPEALEVSPLTPTEQSVLALVAKGLTDREIAMQLGRSEGTVKKHVSNILGKLQVKRRTEAALKAERFNLIARKEN